MKKQKLFLALIFVLLTGCTNIQHLQDLKVDLIGIEPGKMQSMSPRFTIHLLITNPNSEDLIIEGMNFQLDIADHELLAGVATNIPILKAYSETEVSVSSSINVLDFIKLLSVIGSKSESPIKYELNTTIDPKGFIAFNLHHEGVIDELISQGLK